MTDRYEEIAFCCSDMDINIRELQTIRYNEIFDEYGILIPEDNVSYMLLTYCPWCGKELPPSKREEWVESLENLGFEAPFPHDDIPVEYKSAKWRQGDP